MGEWARMVDNASQSFWTMFASYAADDWGVSTIARVLIVCCRRHEILSVQGKHLSNSGPHSDSSRTRIDSGSGFRGGIAILGEIIRVCERSRQRENDGERRRPRGGMADAWDLKPLNESTQPFFATSTFDDISSRVAVPVAMNDPKSNDQLEPEIAKIVAKWTALTTTAREQILAIVFAAQKGGKR
jgi:hypothetical protein